MRIIDFNLFLATLLTGALVGLVGMGIVAGTPVLAQPIPQREQNTRLIHALETNAKALRENTRATQELKRALQSAQNRR